MHACIALCLSCIAGGIDFLFRGDKSQTTASNELGKFYQLLFSHGHPDTNWLN
jgi:hypothetical protein